MTENKTVLITTPGGNIGGPAVAALAELGVPLSVLIRPSSSRDQAPELSSVDVRTGFLNDASSFAAAGVGAKALLLVLPSDLKAIDLPALWKDITDAAVHAIEANKIEHVVLISSQGADSGGSELLDALHDTEKRVAEVTPNLRALRPGPFMENLLQEVHALAEGVLPLLATENTVMHMVATSDIAAIAAEYLADLSWTGHEAVNIHGPQSLTPVDIAEAISAATGRTIEFTPITADEFLKVLMDFGFSPGLALPTVNLFAAFATERPEDPATPTRNAPTTLQQFLDSTLVPALNTLVTS